MLQNLRTFIRLKLVITVVSEGTVFVFPGNVKRNRKKSMYTVALPNVNIFQWVIYMGFLFELTLKDVVGGHSSINFSVSLWTHF